MYDKIDEIWENETVFIVGGGPSLIDFDWSLLDNQKVIGINRAFEVVPNADVLYWTDFTFYNKYKDYVDSFTGMKITTNEWHSLDNSIIKLKATYDLPIDLGPNTLSRGNNSGYGAINLAIKLGAQRIILLGFDMHADSYTPTHWHDGYDNSNPIISPYLKMINQMDQLKQGIDFLNNEYQYNIEVINACHTSKLKCFPLIKLEEINKYL